MRKNENRILLILSAGTIISIFIIIRQCSYPLVYNTALLRWIFLSQGDERIMSNIAYSYIAAYIFYLMQVYIPILINRKRVRTVLATKIKKITIYIYELSYVLGQITHKDNKGLSVDLHHFPLYYKMEYDGEKHIKRVSDSNTLFAMLNRIEELYECLLDKFVIYNLDVGIIELWEELPVEYYSETIKFINLTAEDRTSLVMKGTTEENERVIKRIDSLFGINVQIDFTIICDGELQRKYDCAIKRCGLPELELSLELKA